MLLFKIATSLPRGAPISRFELTISKVPRSRRSGALDFELRPASRVSSEFEVMTQCVSLRAHCPTAARASLPAATERPSITGVRNELFTRSKHAGW